MLMSTTTLHPHHRLHATNAARIVLMLALAAAMALSHSGCAHNPCPIGQILIRGTDAPGMIKMCRPGPTPDELELQRLTAMADQNTPERAKMDAANQAEAERAIRQAEEADATWSVRFRTCKNMARVPDGKTSFEICADEAPPPVDIATATSDQLKPLPVFPGAPSNPTATSYGINKTGN
jgi:hypothetical protein